jgi:hypothetical protein
MQLFKSPTAKADDEFQKAYEKGVNLGREKWPTAVEHFTEASNYYAEAGDQQKANEAMALAVLFTALTGRSQELWSKVNSAMASAGNVQLNVGFPADSSDLEKESLVLSKDIAVMGQFNPQLSGENKVADLRDLAQKYLELVGSDLIIWKLMNQTIDPQRRAYYLLGLASLVEANTAIDTDPKKSASLLSDAVAQLDLAGEDYKNVRPGTLQEMQNATKIGKCWFCGREVQGITFHYFSLKADVTSYMKTKYGAEMPTTMEGQNVMACKACYSSVKYVSDEIASMYFDRAMQELRLVSERVSDLARRVSSLESRVH